MNRLFWILLSLPYTIWFNFRYLPIRQAYKLPIWIACNTRIKQMYRGGIKLYEMASRFNSIHIGYHVADAVDTYSAHTILCVEKGGYIICKGSIHIGQGAIVHCKQGATLSLGDSFAISGTTSIICSKMINIGDNVQLSWSSMIMDSDAHKIFDQEGIWVNPPKAITIGNNVWVAANTTITKGTRICDNTVVASNSLVNKEFAEGDCIVGGQPAKLLKKIGRFEI